jgi:ketosteroid isomerase-like protein
MVQSMREQAPTQQTPTQVMQALFAAIGNGDAEAILATLTDDVEWWVNGPPEVPFAGTFRGHDDVLRYFAAFNDAVDYESGNVVQMIAEGDSVVVVGEERWRAKATGKTADNRWVVVATVPDGRIARFRAYEDTAVCRDAFLPT